MPAPRRFTFEELEELRDHNFCRKPDLKIETVAEAESFVNRNGLVFAFASKSSELPCLWHAACGQRNPVMPRHVQHDPAIGLVWRAKDELPAGKKIYYGKALKRRPTMISLSLFPYFYSIKSYRSEEDFGRISEEGKLSAAGRRIMAALMNAPPMKTKELKIAAGCASPKQRYQFDRAMAELQEKLFAVKVAEQYDPFTFIWGRLDRWLVAEVKRSRSISPEEGRAKVCDAYFSCLVAATARHAEGLLRWTPAELEDTLETLLTEGRISENVEVEGIGGPWYIHTSYL
jgi:hypothetical protein